MVAGHIRGVPQAELQCARFKIEEKPCESMLTKCPSAKHCDYVKCRFAFSKDGKHEYLQVLHHMKDYGQVHQCRMVEGLNGSKQCECTCKGREFQQPSVNQFRYETQLLRR